MTDGSRTHGLDAVGSGPAADANQIQQRAEAVVVVIRALKAKLEAAFAHIQQLQTELERNRGGTTAPPPTERLRVPMLYATWRWLTIVVSLVIFGAISVSTYVLDLEGSVRVGVLHARYSPPWSLIFVSIGAAVLVLGLGAGLFQRNSPPPAAGAPTPGYWENLRQNWREAVLIGLIALLFGSWAFHQWKIHKLESALDTAVTIRTDHLPEKLDVPVRISPKGGHEIFMPPGGTKPTIKIRLEFADNADARQIRELVDSFQVQFVYPDEKPK